MSRLCSSSAASASSAGCFLLLALLPGLVARGRCDSARTVRGRPLPLPDTFRGLPRPLL